MANQERRMAATALMIRGIAAAEAGYNDIAVHLLTEALDIFPDDAEIYHNRGMAFARMQRWHEALADINRSIAIKADSSSYLERGVVYYQIGDRKAARKDWEQALRMDPHEVLVLMNLAMLSFEERRYEETVNYCARAISIEPTFAPAYAYRARAYQELGNARQAFADMQKARQLVEGDEDTSRATRFG